MSILCWELIIQKGKKACIVTPVGGPAVQVTMHQKTTRKIVTLILGKLDQIKVPVMATSWPRAGTDSSAEFERSSGELNLRISREMNGVMNSVSLELQRANNDSISNQVLPQIQYALGAGSGPLTQKRWNVSTERPERNADDNPNQKVQTTRSCSLEVSLSEVIFVTKMRIRLITLVFLKNSRIPCMKNSCKTFCAWKQWNNVQMSKQRKAFLKNNPCKTANFFL